MNTKYILEYKYDDDTEWRFEASYDYPSDAQLAFHDHIETYKFIKARVRQVKYVANESIVGEYSPISVEDEA